VDIKFRIHTAVAALPAFSRIAGLAGFVTGGVAVGFGSVAVGLVPAAAFGLAAFVTFRWGLAQRVDFRGFA
jgi:hypothetical protein